MFKLANPALFVLLMIATVDIAAETTILDIANAPTSQHENVLSWSKYLTERFGKENVIYDVRVEAQWSLVYWTKLQVPGISIHYAVAVGDGYNKNLPFEIEISDTKLLQELGIPSKHDTPLSLDTVEGWSEFELETEGNKNVYRYTVMCWDAGCTNVDVYTQMGVVEKVKWRYSID